MEGPTSDEGVIRVTPQDLPGDNREAAKWSPTAAVPGSGDHQECGRGKRAEPDGQAEDDDGNHPDRDDRTREPLRRGRAHGRVVIRPITRTVMTNHGLVSRAVRGVLRTTNSCPTTPACAIRLLAMTPTALIGERLPALAPLATISAVRRRGTLARVRSYR